MSDATTKILIEQLRQRGQTEAAGIIEAQHDHITKLENHIQLHAGDTLSLGNEADTMRDHWQDAETRIDALKAKRDALAKQVEEAGGIIRGFIADQVDYMTTNRLGDPEQQHLIKWGRGFLATIAEEPKS